MYYRVVDEEGNPFATANNAKSEQEVKEEILELISPEISEEDIQDYQRATLNDILIARGWQLEKQETPFVNYDLEYDETE